MNLENIYDLQIVVTKCDIMRYSGDVTETQEKWMGEASYLRVRQLRQARFTAKEIASMFGVSTRTIHRALKGNKEGGSGDQTTNPHASTDADTLNVIESTASTTIGGLN